MKNSLIVTKISLLILGFFMSGPAWSASEVARITELKGNAFVSRQGKTKTLKAGDLIRSGDEISLEDGAQLSSTDYFDHRYHLGGGSQAVFRENNLELRSGKVWVQSPNSKRQAFVHTANSSVGFFASEFLVSFATSKDRSQLLVTHGEVNFFNRHQRHFAQTVGAGKFSFVDSSYQNGMPRKPTTIGFQSFHTITSDFQGVVPLERNGLLDKKKSPRALKSEIHKLTMKTLNEEIKSLSKKQTTKKDYPNLMAQSGRMPSSLDFSQPSSEGKIIFVQSPKKSSRAQKGGRAPSSIQPQKAVPRRKSGIRFMRVSDVYKEEVKIRTFGKEWEKGEGLSLLAPVEVEQENQPAMAPSAPIPAVAEEKAQPSQDPVEEKQRAPASSTSLGAEKNFEHPQESKKAPEAVLPVMPKEMKEVEKKVDETMVKKEALSDVIRGPASIVKNTQGRSYNQIIPESVFKKSMVEHSKDQSRHSPEVIQLIDELKSYEKDFDPSY